MRSHELKTRRYGHTSIVLDNFYRTDPAEAFVTMYEAQADVAATTA